MRPTERTWAGTTLADRKATRRNRLLDSGLELLGTGVSTAVSVRAVCRQARLTERYFYENFADRNDFVIAVYDTVVAKTYRALVQAVEAADATARSRAEAAVSAFVTLMTDDPRQGRVLLLAPWADPALRHRGGQQLPLFADLVREQLADHFTEAERMMTATALVGGLANLFTAYLSGTLVVSREQLTAHCVRLVLGADQLPA